MANKIENFTAQANINFSIPSSVFPEFREVAKKLFADMREANPTITVMPVYLSAIKISAGERLVFGETAEINENGAVLVYPKAIFDRFSNQYLDAPNPIKGEITPLADGKALKALGLPNDVVENTVADIKKKSYGGRYKKTAALEKVEG